jgi:hypothetical protein
MHIKDKNIEVFRINLRLAFCKRKYQYIIQPRIKLSWINCKWNVLIFGSGTYLYANGDRYTGEWFENLKHGRGQILYSNGDIY